MGYSVLSKYRPQLMGAAMLWVMLFHANDLDLGCYLINCIRAAGFGGVDVFILLSSMGLVISLARREQSYEVFMTRRLSRVLPSYYLVMVPYTVFQVIHYQAPWNTLLWNSLLLAYWTQAVGRFNWYIFAAVTFYCVTPFFFRQMRGSRRRERIAGLGILGGLLASQLMLQEGLWSYLDILYRTPLFFLGLLLGFYALEDRRLGWKDLLFWCLSLGAGVLYLFAVFGQWEHVLIYPSCHLFLFTTVPMCLTACWCFERLPLDWLRKPLRLLGRYSLEIYLLNVSVFSEVELLRWFVPRGPGGWVYFLLSCAANISLGVLLHQAVKGLSRRAA